MKIDDFIIYETAKIGNTYFTKGFLEGNKIPKYLLHYSTISRNFELVRYVLEQKGINVNFKNI